MFGNIGNRNQRNQLLMPLLKIKGDMEMEKVKVNKELYKALRYTENMLLPKNVTYKEVFLIHYVGKKFVGLMQIINELSAEKIIEILSFGYELEETKEEKLLNIYKNHDNHYAYGSGIKKALEVLEIEIKGINC